MEKVILENETYVCGQMSLLTDAESTVRLTQAASFHPDTLSATSRNVGAGARPW